MTERIFEIGADDTEGVLEWLETAADKGVREAYLSGAVLHAVTRGDAGLDARGLGGLLSEAGFSHSQVEPIEPSIEDVFVHLVSEQRQEGQR